MRYITYAGETVITSDEVAEALIELTAAVAQRGHAEAVRIPICNEGGKVDSAELVIGVGNDVLSAPADWDGDEVDFAHEASGLRGHPLFPQKMLGPEKLSAVRTEAERQQQAAHEYDYEMDEIDRA